MTISSSGPISLSDIATEYDLSLNNLDFNRVSNIARLPASRDIGSFRGTSANDFTGKVDYFERVTGVGANANKNGLAGSLGSVRALVNMSDATTGVIFEVGASGVGFVLYVYSGAIYAQYGDGDVVGGDYEVSYTVPSTWTTDETHEIVVSCDSRGYGLARMYIDGILVSTEYNATPSALNDIAGTNDAGIGKVHSALAYTRMNQTDDSSENSFPFTGGTIQSVSTYRQVTAVPHVQIDTFTSNTYTSGVIGATNILNGQERVTILTNVTIDKDSTGVIYESGATGDGLALYVHGGKLYIEAGAGSVLGGTINTNWTIPDYISLSDRTEIIASAEITSTSSRAKLFVNNREVATSTGAGAGNDLSGSDGAGTGQVYGTLRYTQLNPANGSSAGLLQYTGTIYDTQVYSGIFHPYAAGGTITDVTIDGDTYRIHAFTTVGTSTLVMPETRECDVLLVAGGGGGGGVTSSGASGGGGAGGLVFNSFSALQGQQYTITVGDGGTAGGDALENGGNGGNTTGFGLTAKGGGGGGGSSDGNVWLAGSAGGSGGGGGGGDTAIADGGNGPGGASTQPGTNSGVTTDAGFAGGASASNDGDCGGGGGGAGEVGDTFQGKTVGNGYNIQGGDGLDMSSYFTPAFGDSGWFAGGGGAFARNDNISRAGGLGGGGAGGSSGTANTGGGGGGRDAGVLAGAGGSGIVLIRYRIS
jgi:hypothetical protein